MKKRVATKYTGYGEAGISQHLVIHVSDVADEKLLPDIDGLLTLLLSSSSLLFSCCVSMSR